MKQGREADRLVNQNPDSAQARLISKRFVQKQDYAAAQEQIDKVLKHGEHPNQPPAQAKPDKVAKILKATHWPRLSSRASLICRKGEDSAGLASFKRR